MDTEFDQAATAKMWGTGTLAGATKVIDVSDGLPIPCTVTLNSTDPGRAIEVSTDGGTNWLPVVYDNNTAAQLVVVCLGQMSHIRFTGAVSDTWNVR